MRGDDKKIMVEKFFDLFFDKGIFSSRLMVEPMLYKA